MHTRTHVIWQYKIFQKYKHLPKSQIYWFGIGLLKVFLTDKLSPIKYFDLSCLSIELVESYKQS